MASPPTSNPPISSLKSPFPPLPIPLLLSPQQLWEKFADDIDSDHDALSFSDLPQQCQHDPQKEREPPDAFEEFEFLTSDNGRFLHADHLFHQGQLLPLGASVSNSSCSSASMSRSQSSSSDYSSNSVLPRFSVSNRFYARPSPKPQLRTNVVSGRKSTSSVPRGWGLCRVGVVKAPEIEINDLRSRLVKSNDKKRVESREKPRIGFGCKCATDVLEPVMMPTTRANKEKKSDDGKARRKSNRVFQWLEDVSFGNGPSVGLKSV